MLCLCLLKIIWPCDTIVWSMPPLLASKIFPVSRHVLLLHPLYVCHVLCLNSLDFLFQKDNHMSLKFLSCYTWTFGDLKVPYHSKYRYFLTIIDDFSRNTWVYLLPLKSDSLTTLKSFLKYVSNHFQKSVKYIRSDNALEFTSGPRNQFFSDLGIIHQKSCPYRPQQNARDERMHRYILEVARALRFRAGLPLSFGGACVPTAVHLINKLPTPILHNKSPHELLHNAIPEYDNLRVFGCLAFDYNPTHSHDKFEHRGVPCVFLGYHPRQKGYRLMNLATKQEFSSRDVLFYESIFPFHPESPSKYMHHVPPMPIQLLTIVMNYTLMNNLYQHFLPLQPVLYLLMFLYEEPQDPMCHHASRFYHKQYNSLYL